MANDDERCVECGTLLDDDGRYYSDGTGDVLGFCRQCAEREFGGRQHGESAPSPLTAAEGTDSFSITGTFANRSVTVTWHAPRIEGDPEAVAYIRDLVHRRTDIGGPVPSSFEASLAESWLAEMTIHFALEDGAVTAGRPADPPWFADPPGTIY